MEEAKVFYAQSSSQMIRKQGEPDEKAMRREIREREMQAFGPEEEAGKTLSETSEPESLLLPLFSFSFAPFRLATTHYGRSFGFHCLSAP
jgi:hypothetical protein